MASKTAMKKIATLSTMTTSKFFHIFNNAKYGHFHLF